MVIERLKAAIDSCWAKHMTFRVAFIVAFLFSMIAIPIYAFSVFWPLSGWIVLVLLAAYFASGKYRTSLHPRDLAPRPGFRMRYWWLPLVLNTLAMASLSYYNYTLNQIDLLVLSATLCLIGVGCLVYYSTRKG